MLEWMVGSEKLANLTLMLPHIVHKAPRVIFSPDLGELFPRWRSEPEEPLELSDSNCCPGNDFPSTSGDLYMRLSRQQQAYTLRDGCG